jgi:hypothetical protein
MAMKEEEVKEWEEDFVLELVKLDSVDLKREIHKHMLLACD